VPTRGSMPPAPTGEPCGSARTTPPSTSSPSAHRPQPAGRRRGPSTRRWGQIRRAQPAQGGAKAGEHTQPSIRRARDKQHDAGTASPNDAAEPALGDASRLGLP
jgi:hypothetical protein